MTHLACINTIKLFNSDHHVFLHQSQILIISPLLRYNVSLVHVILRFLQVPQERKVSEECQESDRKDQEDLLV